MTLNVSPVSFGSKPPKHRINPAEIADYTARTVEDIKLKQRPAEVQQEVARKRAVSNTNIGQWMKNLFVKYMCDNTPDEVSGIVANLNH